MSTTSAAILVPTIVGPFAGLGVGYALSSPGHRTWPMVAGFFLGAFAGSGISAILTAATPASALAGLPGVGAPHGGGGGHARPAPPRGFPLAHHLRPAPPILRRAPTVVVVETTPANLTIDASAYNLAAINQYRASGGLPALVLDGTLSAFALAGSQELTQTHQSHQHFINAGQNGTLWTQGFYGAAGENQSSPDGWTLLGSVNATIDNLLAAMMAEGPGGGHYQNIMNRAYRRLGVGLVQVGGNLYVTNDFSA